MSTADVVRSYLAAFADGDADAIAAHVTDDFVNAHESALGSGCAGRDEYRQRLPEFLDQFDGLRYDDVEVIAEGDRAAATYRLRASHDGHEVDIGGVMVFTLRDGRIASRIDVWDSLTFLRQIDRA